MSDQHDPTPAEIHAQILEQIPAKTYRVSRTLAALLTAPELDALRAGAAALRREQEKNDEPTATCRCGHQRKQHGVVKRATCYECACHGFDALVAPDGLKRLDTPESRAYWEFVETKAEQSRKAGMAPAPSMRSRSERGSP